MSVCACLEEEGGRREGTEFDTCWQHQQVCVTPLCARLDWFHSIYSGTKCKLFEMRQIQDMTEQQRTTKEFLPVLSGVTFMAVGSV